MSLFLEVCVDSLASARAAICGGAASCIAGCETLRRLLALRDELGGPEVMIGAGSTRR